MEGPAIVRADYKTEPANHLQRSERIPDALAGKRVDQALAILFPDYSRSRLQQWIRDGHVTIDGAPCTGKNKVHGGETVLVQLQANAEELAFRGVPVVISNHHTEFTESEYALAETHVFDVARRISCKAANRRPATEVLALFC